jgi:hypothetical protein
MKTVNMRHLLFILFTILIFQANGQSFTNYKDTVNHFSINIPEGWTYGKDADPSGVKLIAYRTPKGNSDTARLSMNINIIATPKKDLDKTFSDLLRYLDNPYVQDYKLVDKGDIIINGIKFKWLIETHKNDDIRQHHYDFVALKDGKTYILTMVAFSHYFDTVKPLFEKIANSLILQ